MTIIIVLILIIVAYYVGKHDGVIKANSDALYPGAWAQITDDLWIKTIGKKEVCIPEYTQVIITGRDKWGRISIWLVHPLANIQGRNFYGIKKFAKFKIIDPYRIGKETYEEATKSLAKFEESVSQWHVPGLHNLWP